MKKLLLLFMFIMTFNASLKAYIDCGCAFPVSGADCVDMEISYQGNGDCCNPVGAGFWSHLDCASNDIIDGGNMNSGDAAAVCDDKTDMCD